VLTRRDKFVLAVMVGIPLAVFLVLIWAMALASVVLSFTDWQGLGPLNFVGLQNYQYLFSGYQAFWPAVSHNLLWLIFFVCFATPMGILLAVCLDRPLRGSAIYQSIFFTPVVLSLAVVGFIWELQYSPIAGNGFIDSVLVGTGLVSSSQAPDWLGNPSLNIWAVLVAASWRHIGYIMVLYLAGLKSVDPTLREAAAIDGANERQTFFHIVFPVMAPINTVVIVVTVIESLRAFDIVYIINHGKGGLELLSTLITNNSISEASLIGFGSAIAVVLLVISLVPIVLYLSRVMRTED
jgi:multiple sugar transport system permease protein/raffinose/stachyose/melibiose transport system permease protein